MLGFDCATEAGEVGVAHVIDEDDDDVGPLGRVKGANEEEGEKKVLHRMG